MRTREPTTQAAGADATTRLLTALAGWWWVGGILFYGVGDLTTTMVGLQRPVVVEASPVVSEFIASTGLWVMLPLKLLVFGIAYAMWVVVPRPHNVGVPLGLFALGVVLTVWNLFVLIATA
jgi:hypothetical protein